MPGDGVHGRIHPHARRTSASTSDAGSRSTPTCRPTSRGRCSTPPSPSRSARWSARKRSPRCATSRTTSRCAPCDLIPAARGRVQRALRPRLGRAHAAPTAPTTPRRSSSRMGSLQRHDPGHGRRDARRQASAIGSLVDLLVPAVPARGAARGAARRKRVVVLEKMLAVGHGRHRSPTACARRCRASQLHGYTRRSRASAAGRSRARRCIALVRAGAGATSSTPTCISSTSTRRDRGRTSSRASPRCAAPARRPRTSCARRRARPRRRNGGTMDDHDADDQVKFYQTGTLHRRQPAARPKPSASVQASTDRTNSLTCGPPACQGCGEALGARYAIDAAMRATERQAHRRQRHRLPRGLHDALSRRLPGRCRGSIRSSATPPRSRRASPPRMRVKGTQRRARDRAGRRRRHHRHRLRVPLGHVRAQRRRALHLLRQRGLHEHRRAALLGDAARRRAPPPRRPWATSPATSSAPARTCR